MWHENGWRTVWFMLARGYLKSLTQRDFRFQFLVNITNWFGESVIFQLFVLGCKDQNHLCKYCHYFPFAKCNSGSSSQCNLYGNVSVWLEIKAGLLKRTTARKVLHRLHTGQLKQRWTKRFSNIINVPIPSLINTMISVSFVDENFWIRLR